MFYQYLLGREWMINKMNGMPRMMPNKGLKLSRKVVIFGRKEIVRDWTCWIGSIWLRMRRPVETTTDNLDETNKHTVEQMMHERMKERKTKIMWKLLYLHEVVSSTLIYMTMRTVMKQMWQSQQQPPSGK